MTRPFASLAGAVLLLGTADAMAGTYLVLFASDHAGMSPVQIGVFTAAPAAGGLVVSAIAGWLFDRSPARTYAIAAAALNALGLVLLTTTTSFPLLVLIALTLLAAGTAAFPQLFSLARVVLGDGAVSRRSTPLLRSGWSVAWALGPLAGTALLPHIGFTGVLLVSAAVLVLTVVSTASVPAPRSPESPVRVSRRPARPVPRRQLSLLVAGAVLFFQAMFAGSVALPLYVTRGLHQPDTAVGVLYSVCAAVEVVAALALAALPHGWSQRALIAGGMLTMAAYFAITVLADGMPLLVIGQAARGVAIAVVSVAGIRYFQDLLAPATGRATTLFTNATTAGALLAGLLAGAAVQHWGYSTTLFLCAASALTGATAVTMSTPAALRGHPSRA